MNPPPAPFGDPTQTRKENRAAVGKGCFLGCGGCAMGVVLFVGLLVGIAALVMNSFRKSDVCVEALEKVRASAVAKATLGTPIEQGWWLSGSINLSGNQGDASVAFPISGPKGGATLHATASKVNGKWIFSRLVMVPDRTGKPVDLLAPVSITWLAQPASVLLV